MSDPDFPGDKWPKDGFPMPFPQQFAAMTPDEFATFWQTFEAMESHKLKPLAGRYYIGKHDIRDMVTLKRAGWTPEPLSRLSQPMSWYWRRPSRRTDKEGRPRPGMRFNSTQQAINELRREAAKDPAKQSVHLWSITLEIAGIAYPGSLPAKNLLEAQRLCDSIGATVHHNSASALPLPGTAIPRAAGVPV